MRLSFRNKNICLLCNKKILYSNLYKCKYCSSLYHKICLNDRSFLNNNKKCIYCQKSIIKSKSIIKDIIRECCCDLVPIYCIVSFMIGIFVYFRGQ